MVLLCGRPGLGKTTLAHVVASHAGYNVVEMNASDERTAQAFKDKIEDSLTMQPLLGGKESRPNCLLIDEIDGAPAVSSFCQLHCFHSSQVEVLEQFWRCLQL